FGPYHEDTDHPWHRLERGESSLASAREEIIEIGRAAGFEIDPIRLLIEGMGSHEPREDLIALVKRVRADGVRTALVTNNVREFGDGWRKLVPVEELFDEVIDSSAEGCRKPDSQIFHLALERVGGVEAGRSVFLDDFHGNIDAARSLGIEAVLVEPDHRPAIRALERLLGYMEGGA
ncbi:MAG: HAD-IA family hydrolase, partial [Actinomycetota bacterium]|nr:HAD-IA family hydrolase [Actinomycetota bacterium]